MTSTPLSAGAMSESTRSTCRPGRRRSSSPKTASSRKSPCTNSTPASSRSARMSVATMRPLRPTRSLAYWLQAPGAAPRSRQVCPGFSSRARRSISSSLYTARDRQPSRCARCTNGSAKCSFSHLSLLLERRPIGSVCPAQGQVPPAYNGPMEKPRPAAGGPSASASAAASAAEHELTERQRRHLRGLAHALKPVVRLGSAGLTEAIAAETARALGDHELIKVKAPGGDRAARDELFAELARRTGSALVHRIGHVAVLYRPRAEPPGLVIPGRRS